MITREELNEEGYRNYHTAHKGPFCTALWQRWIWGGDKKLYAINFYLWEFPDQHPMVSVEVRMYTETDEFDLNLFVNDKTVAQVEAFYADAYNRLGCVPDRNNND